MTATPGLVGPTSVEPDVDPGELLSRLLEELGLGWGLLLGLVVPTLVVVAIGIALAVWLWRRTGRSPSTSTGSDLFPGRVVTLRNVEGTTGQVFVEGSWWSVRSTGATLDVDEDVRVTAVEGLVLVVEPLDAGASSQEEP